MWTETGRRSVIGWGLAMAGGLSACAVDGVPTEGGDGLTMGMEDFGQGLDVLTPGGVSLNLPSWYFGGPVLASDGEQFLMAADTIQFEGRSSLIGLAAGIYDSAGRRLFLSERLPSQYASAAVYGDERYLVTWTDNSDICFCLLNRDATLVSPGERCFNAGDTPLNVRAAWNGSAYQLLWSQFNSYTSVYELRGIQLDADGLLIDTQPRVLYQPDDWVYLVPVASGLGWDGQFFQVQMAEGNETASQLLMMRLDAQGIAVDGSVRSLESSGGVTSSAMATTPELTYHFFSTDQKQLWVYRSLPTGLVLDATPVRVLNEEFLSFTVVPYQNRAMLAWVPASSSGTALYAGMVDESGGMAGEASFVASSPSELWAPTATAGSSQVFLAWNDGRIFNFLTNQVKYNVRGTSLRP